MDWPCEHTGNIKEYRTINKYITCGKKEDLDRFISRVNDEYYLAVARDALERYTGYFGDGYVECYDGNHEQVFVSDRISGGILLNSDKVINDTIRIGLLLKDRTKLDGYALDQFKDKHGYSTRIIETMDSLDLSKFTSVGRIYQDEDKNEELRKQGRATRVIVKDKYGVYSHEFYQHIFDALKLLGGDTKLHIISSPKNVIYAESSKGKGLILGLSRED